MILILTNANADYTLHINYDREKSVLLETLKPYILKKFKCGKVLILGLSLNLGELAQNITTWEI